MTRPVETPRDPRVDPKPGDVLRKGKRVRTVLVVSKVFNRVTYTTASGIETHVLLSYWADWADNAEVLNAAD